MFGHNEVVGQKFFREHPEARAGKLLVTSVFHTLQGEGPFAGMPAVFIRLAMCNLSCTFCDTYFDHGDWLDFGELRNRMLDACGLKLVPPELVVVTGGEPTLQVAQLERFVSYITSERPFRRVQVESNGILSLPLGCINVVSPKCAEIAGRPTRYLTPSNEVLHWANCLKFVMSGDPDTPYHQVPPWALEWRRETGREVYVSPMAEYCHTPEDTRVLYDERRSPDFAQRTAAEKISFWEPGLLNMVACRRNYEYAALYAMEHNLRLSIQQHLFASLP